MKKQQPVSTTTVYIVDEFTKSWQEKEVRKSTITVEKRDDSDKKTKSDEVSPDKMWRQENTWIVVGG